MSFFRNLFKRPPPKVESNPATIAQNRFPRCVNENVHDWRPRAERMSQITVESMPSSDWNRAECVAWLHEFLVQKIHHTRDDAAWVANQFMETGMVLLVLSQAECENLFGPGGRSIYLRLRQVRKLEFERLEGQDLKRYLPLLVVCLK